jgi:uncharacterized SAM-binding protein YcdF (DUF218 family)
MLFALKKVVSRLLFPLPFTVLLLAAGLILTWSGRHTRTGRALLAVGIVLLALLSSTVFSNALLRPLESRYPALGPAELAAIDWEAIDTIVVFSGCSAVQEQYPVTRQVSETDLGRLVEGIRLYQECPSCTMVLSGGGSGCDPLAPVESLTNYRLAVAMGVAPEDIVLERASLDTADQARILKEMLGETPFIVVTSASHMPRTMALFYAQGLRAIPAPTDYGVGLFGPFTREGFQADSIYPNARALTNSERAVYEYLGILWAALRGQ